MSIFSKIAEFLFGPTTPAPAPKETKVEVINTQSVAPQVQEVAPPAAKKTRAPAKKKDDSWLNSEVKKPAGRKPQSAAGKTVAKPKAKAK